MAAPAPIARVVSTSRTYGGEVGVAGTSRVPVTMVNTAGAVAATTTPLVKVKVS